MRLRSALPAACSLLLISCGSGELDTYSARQAQGSAVGDNGGSAATGGTLYFQEDWGESVAGALHAGGWLGVFFDLDRLPQCRGTHNGHPAWDTVAHVRFLPGGESDSGSVRELINVNGTPTNQARERLLQLRVPREATAVELWFHNYSGAGSSCEAWDSNYGANYAFDLLPPADDPRCEDVDQWTRIYGGTPTCTPYTLDAQYAATNCELYVEGFGHGREGHYGIPFEWLEAYVVVGPQSGELLNVGMWTQYTDPADGGSHGRYSLGSAVADSTFKTGFTFLSTATQGTPGYHYGIERFAFFVDVRRPSGEVVRLWESRGGADYTWGDGFGAGTTIQYIPYGRMEWAVADAAIFDRRRACR